MRIIGIFFCFGIILEPLAIQKALKARKMIEANPRVTGSGKATAAHVLPDPLPAVAPARGRSPSGGGSRHSPRELTETAQPKAVGSHP